MAAVAQTAQIKALLHNWLVRQVPVEPMAWLTAQCKKLGEGCSQRLLFTTFSSIPRYTGKADLLLTAADLSAAENARTGWAPLQWSLDQIGRSLLLLSLPAEDGAVYYAHLEQLFGAADVSEQIALYQSLPLLPHPERFVNRAAEGLRTSIDAVFNAVALNNPFPGDYFECPTWNQMILKAVFVGSPLHLIQQLDARANAELARMLSDYAHERWAAKREVTPELWRLISPYLSDPYLNGQLLADIQHVLKMPDKVQQLAAALACTQSSWVSAQDLLSHYPDVLNEIESQALTWEQFSQDYLAA